MEALLASVKLYRGPAYLLIAYMFVKCFVLYCQILAPQAATLRVCASNAMRRVTKWGGSPEMALNLNKAMFGDSDDDDVEDDKHAAGPTMTTLTSTSKPFLVTPLRLSIEGHVTDFWKFKNEASEYLVCMLFSGMSFSVRCTSREPD